MSPIAVKSAGAPTARQAKRIASPAAVRSSLTGEWREAIEAWKHP